MFDTTQTAVFYATGNHVENFADHRVWLRRFLRDGPFRPLVMILHNPSSAGEITNDPTARRGIGLALRLGASDLIFVNAVTRIATKATDIPVDEDLNCPWSDWALAEAARLATENGGWLVACWGSPKGKAAVQRKIAERFDEIKRMGLPLSVLRLTPKGFPEHPLYLPNELAPVTWEYR